MKKKYLEVLQNARILLVDDDQNFRESYLSYLSRYCKNIYEASNGEEALKKYFQYKVNIIFTDLEMPFQSGLDLTSKIKADNPKIPIVLTSAYTEKDDLLQFISLGITEYLVKPIHPDKLKKAIIKCAETLIENSLIEFYFATDEYYSFSQKIVVSKNKELSLTAKEIQLIELFIENQDKTVSKELIEYTLYENKYMTESALNNLLSKFRKKVPNFHIQTIHNIGYKFLNKKD